MSIITKQLNTEARRKTFIARPLIDKYFEGDLSLKSKRGLVKGMSELLNNILEKYYNSLSESDRQALLNEFEKINKR